MIRVLYAEDDPNIASVVRSYFEHFGGDCGLEVVGTGQECLERMARGGVDVLLLDLVLPDIDGLHILGDLAMRRDPTPVVMISGHGQNDLAVRALRAGAVDCVDKTTGQFLQVVDIVKRAHAASLARPHAGARPAASAGSFRVTLVEGAAGVEREIRDFINRHAPQVTLASAADAAGYHAFIRGGYATDAVLVGPNPPTGRPLDIVRQLHSEAAQVPVLLLADSSDGETAVAAFKLGAQDYILRKPDYLAEMVFSLNNTLRRVDIERQNARLTRELEELNRSLEAQVAERTAELRALSSRLLRIQEDERRAIARELHDQVGQMLTGLKFQLEAAAQGGPPAKDKLAEALGTATELMRHVRELTQLYRPRILDDLGLRHALEWHANQFHRQTGVAVALDLGLPGERLPSELETVIFRMTQEALTNIARHAQTQAASVSVTAGDRHLLVEISDRGRGFDLAAVLARHDAIGLAGLRERVSLAGGQLEIFSQPGQGTRLHAEFPLPEPGPAPAAGAAPAAPPP